MSSFARYTYKKICLLAAERRLRFAVGLGKRQARSEGSGEGFLRRETINLL
jgi:hypothetical protein